MQQNSNSVVVLGPTASGKTRLGVAIAKALSGEIVSADSRQVYRGLNIGAGKDLVEYGSVPYHLIDIADLADEYSVFQFQRDCFAVVSTLFNRGSVPVIVGGTGLYIEAVLNEYRMVDVPEDPILRAELDALTDEELVHRLRAAKPDQHNTTDTLDRRRAMRAIEIAEHSRHHDPQPGPGIRATILGVRWPRDVLRDRIAQRLRDRIEQGLVDEVKDLLASGVSSDRINLLGLEYRYVNDYLTGAIRSRNDLRQKLNTAIAQFAKRQETWFRRMERNGHRIHWIDEGNLDQAMSILRAAGFRQ